MADPHSTSITTLIRDVVGETRELIRDEIALAKAEIREEMTAVQSAGVSFSAAMLLAVLGIALFLVALGGAIAYLFGAPAWVGYGIVALLAGGAAFFFLSRGRTQVANIRMLPKTSETLRENMEWMRSRSSRT